VLDRAAQIFPNARRSAVFGLLLGLYAATIVLESASQQLRYLKYGLPFATLAMIAVSRAKPVPLSSTLHNYFRTMLGVTAVACVVSLVGALIENSLTSRFIGETYFVISPLVIAAVAFPYVNREQVPEYVRWSFLVVVIAYVLDTKLAVLTAMADPTSFLSKLLMTEDGAESNTAFLFGLYSMYFAFTGRRRWAFGAFVLVIIAFKRIVPLAIVVALLVRHLASRRNLAVQRHAVAYPILAVAVNTLILWLTIELANGGFDDLFVDTVGISADWATQGRTGVWRLIITSMPLSALGEGLGSVTHLLQENGATILNAHSDLLKYAVEVGPVMAVLWIYNFFRVHTRHADALAFAVYLNVLLVTDNVSIYVPVMLLFYVLVGFLYLRAEPNHA